MDKVKKTYKDDKPRLKWRAKQNIDFAYMMLYCRNISMFYMQIEDDLVTATDFIYEIEKFEAKVSKTKPQWFLLEFSYLGFIGKFFHSSDLYFVANQLIDRYDDKPCDLLLGLMRILKSQEKPIHSEISLFQHIGRFSSLQGKIMPLLDDKFKDQTKLASYMYQRLVKGDNPPGTVYTTMAAATDSNIPIHAYDGNQTTFFWATTPRPKQVFVWIFNRPHNFSRIMLDTGAIDTHKDSLANANLEFSTGPVSSGTGTVQCNPAFKKMTTLMSGSVDTLAMGISVPQDIKCLRIMVLRRAKTWLILRDLQVFISNSGKSVAWHG